MGRGGERGMREDGNKMGGGRGRMGVYGRGRMRRRRVEAPRCLFGMSESLGATSLVLITMHARDG